MCISRNCLLKHIEIPLLEQVKRVHVVYTTAKQVIHRGTVITEICINEKCTCKAHKTSVKYVNLLRCCRRRRRDCLSTLMFLTDALLRAQSCKFKVKRDCGVQIDRLLASSRIIPLQYNSFFSVCHVSKLCSLSDCRFLLNYE